MHEYDIYFYRGKAEEKTKEFPDRADVADLHRCVDCPKTGVPTDIGFCRICDYCENKEEPIPQTIKCSFKIGELNTEEGYFTGFLYDNEG